MIEIDKKACKMLEFDKILKMLELEASCSESKNIVLKNELNYNYDEVITEIEKTNDAYKLLMGYGNLPIQPVSNINNIIGRAKLSARLDVNEFLNISNLLNIIFRLTKWKKQSKDVKTSLDYLFDKLDPLFKLKNNIDSIIISEDEIADDASDELFSIRKKIRLNSTKIKDSLEKMIGSSTYQKYLQEAIVTIRDGRFVIPVKAEYKTEIKGLVHDSSISGATLFIEPIFVVEANNAIKLLEKQEQDEIDIILEKLSDDVRQNIDDIERNYKILISLDVYFAKAKFGCKINGVIPKINNCGKINLIKARHPLIDKDKVVPININVGYNFDSLVITGPNTGGKTVALKTVGVLTLMAMSGLMIPANEESEISVFEHILVDIGDEQSIEQSLSTFSAHMVNIINILKFAGPKTLTLIDELGAGTDPVEGASLATAILEKLKEKQTKIISTTHYSELKLYALNTNRVENASCEFDVKTLRATYNISIGVPGSSNAFSISKRLGLNEEILEKAKSLVSNENNKFEDVIVKLEKSKIELEEEKQIVINLKNEIEKEKNQIVKIKEELEKNYNLEIDKAKKEAEKIILKTQESSKAVLNEVDELLKNKNAENFNKMVLDVKSKIKSQFNNLNTKVAYNSSITDINYIQTNKKISNGDEVRILDIDQIGKVIAEPGKNGSVFVQIGAMKRKTNISNLVPVKKKINNHKLVVSKKIGSRINAKVQQELHVRGMTVEEALFEIDKFIDNAIIMGICTVKIVHGKGTGVLRRSVHDYLKENKSVKDFRLGIFGEGEDGVTIVNLKN